MIEMNTLVLYCGLIKRPREKRRIEIEKEKQSMAIKKKKEEKRREDQIETEIQKKIQTYGKARERESCKK